MTICMVVNLSVIFIHYLLTNRPRLGDLIDLFL